MARGPYTRGVKEALTLGWGNLDLRIALLRDTGAYTFDPDHDFVADLVATHGAVELSAANYPATPATRLALPSPTLTLDDSGDEVEADADNPTFVDIGQGDSPAQNAAAAVIYIHKTTDADSILLYYDETNFPYACVGVDLTPTLDAQGLIRFRSVSTP